MEGAHTEWWLAMGKRPRWPWWTRQGTSPMAAWTKGVLRRLRAVAKTATDPSETEEVIWGKSRGPRSGFYNGDSWEYSTRGQPRNQASRPEDVQAGSPVLAAGRMDSCLIRRFKINLPHNDDVVNKLSTVTMCCGLCLARVIACYQIYHSCLNPKLKI